MSPLKQQQCGGFFPYTRQCNELMAQRCSLAADTPCAEYVKGAPSQSMSPTIQGNMRISSLDLNGPLGAYGPPPNMFHDPTWGRWGIQSRYRSTRLNPWLKQNWLLLGSPPIDNL